jgi:Flp pilus assembly protein TadG
LPATRVPAIEAIWMRKRILQSSARGMSRAERSVSARRRRRSGGNTFLEWVFTLLPSIALMSFFCDVTFAMFSWSTLQNAVREGCRYAITFQTSGSLGQNASIEQVVEQYSMGLITTTNSSLMQITYYSPSAPNTAITSGGNIPGNLVQVAIVGYPVQWLFPLSGMLVGPLWTSSTSMNINVYSLDVLGAYPAGVTSVTE